MAIQRTTSLSIFRTISNAVSAQTKPLSLIFAFFVLLMMTFFTYKLWVVKRERAVQYDFSSLMTEYETMSHEENPEWDKLLEKFEKNYEKNSNSSLLPYYLSYKVRILLNQNKPTEALEVLDTMITNIPGSPMLSLYEMERALIQLDETDVAMQTTGLEALKKLSQDTTNKFRDSAQYYLGRYYWAKNEIDLARQVWQELVDGQRDEKMAPSPWVSHVQDKLTLTII